MNLKIISKAVFLSFINTPQYYYIHLMGYKYRSTRLYASALNQIINVNNNKIASPIILATVKTPRNLMIFASLSAI